MSETKDIDRTGRGGDVLRPQRTYDFDALWNLTNDDIARLCAFVLLELEGEDYRDRPWIERNRRLAAVLPKAGNGLDYVEHLYGDGQRIFDHACKLQLEGIVLKRIDLPYRAGPFEKLGEGEEQSASGHAAGQRSFRAGTRAGWETLASGVFVCE